MRSCWRGRGGGSCWRGLFDFDLFVCLHRIASHGMAWMGWDRGVVICSNYNVLGSDLRAYKGLKFDNFSSNTLVLKSSIRYRLFKGRRNSLKA